MHIDTLRTFNQELYSLAKTNMPLPEGLSRAGRMASDSAAASKLNAAAERISSGVSLSDALAAENFPAYYCALIKAGEISGDLRSILSRLVEYFSARKRLYDSLKSTVSYPLLQAAAVMFLVPLLSRVVSGLALEFQDLMPGVISRGGVMITISRTVLSVGELLGGALLPVCLAAAGWLFYVALKPGDGIVSFLYRITTHLPLLGTLLQYDSSTRLCWGMFSMLKSGIPACEALRALSGAEPDQDLSNSYIAAAELIESGKGIGESLGRCSLLPDHVSSVIEISESHGDIIQAFEDSARYLEEETTMISKILPNVWEVILVIVAGLFIGSLIISVTMPMMQLINGSV